MTKKRWITLILTLTLLSMWLPAAAQAQNGLEMRAGAAYGGYFKYGEWLPVWIELENQGNDIEAEVRVQVSGAQGSTVFAMPVSLPSGSRKEFPLYVLPNNFSRELKVSLVRAGQALASQQVSVRPQPNITFLVGVVSPERGALGMLNGIVLPGQDRPKVITELPLKDLPDRPEALRSFDVLVFNNTDTSRLSPGQASAVESWVQAGGRLVVGGGPGAMQTASGLPESILPVRIQSTIELDDQAITDLARFANAGPILSQQRFVAASGVPISGSLLAGTQEIPLVFERPVGNGSVDFVAFDLSGVPFNGWPGTQAFWEKLLAPGSIYPQNIPFDVSVRQMRGNQLSYALSNIPSLDLPSIQGLSILLLVYILMVGPVNYLVLRQLKRLHLAWVTIPALTILFTAGAFATGYVMRGTDLLVNKIAIIEVQPGGSAAVTSYLGLFSPRQQSYEILVDSSGLVSPMTTYDSGWGPGGGMPSSGSEMVFTQGNPAVIKGLTVNQFAMQSFMAEETWREFGHISANLRLENDLLVGTVRNETAYTISDVVVAIQNRFKRLGDLAPGQEVNVDIGLSSLQSERFGPPLSYMVFQDRMNMNGPTPRAVDLKINILSAVLDNNAAWGMKAALSSQFPPPGGDLSATRGNPVTIFGWMDQAPPNVEIKNNRLSQQTTALVYTTASFQIPADGEINLPPGMVSGTLVKPPRDGGPCGPANMASVSMSSGEAEFEFQVPSELIEARLKALRLNIWRDSGGDWALPEISLWNWQSEAWNTIQDPVMGINEIQEPGALVNEAGTIRLRLKNDNNNMYACYYFDMGLSAESAQGQGGGR